MPEEKIGVIGISTLDGPLRPNGNHLRWTFPSALGFPPKGFRIFRRDSKKPSGKSVRFLGLPLDVALGDDLRIDGLEFLAHPGGRALRCRQSNQERSLVITPPTLAQLEVRFPEPVVHVRTVLSGSGYGTLRAFNDRLLLAEVVTGGTVRELFGAGITRITFDLGPGQLSSISFTTESETCNANDWALLKKLPLPETDQNALKLLEFDLKNYYAPNSDSARSSYGGSALEIVTWLKRLLAPTIDFFEDPESAPDSLKVRSGDKGPTTATYPQSLFFMAALDPNVARLMCLYWVDAYQPADQPLLPPPNKNSFYDYKVEGVWNDGDGRCGLLLNLGQPSAPLPSLQDKLIGQQVNGLRWIGREMYGRIGLKWPKPGLGNTPQARAVQPVLYEMTRISDNKEETIDEPILVENKSWKAADAVLYIDRELVQGSYIYKVRPIDLFGQIGLPIKSEKIEIGGNHAPPPPIRTRSVLTQKEGATPSLRAQFEFGAAQHQQAPAVENFVAYWLADSLFNRRTINVVVSSTDESPNGFVHTLRIRDESQGSIPFTELETFAGDVITNVITGASETLPANARRRFRIARAVAPDKVVLEAAPHLLPNGAYELVRDPHNRTLWNPLSPQIAWREPIAGVLRAVELNVSVQVVGIPIISQRQNPFASVPAEKRPRNFPDLPPATELMELEVNRVLTEPDVFAGGQATKTDTNETFELIYVITSPTDGVTRIALPADVAVVKGDTLDLSPAHSMRSRVRKLSISGMVDTDRLLTPGGEIAFETGDVTSIVRVISNAVNHSGVFDVVVRAENAASVGLMRINESHMRYYAPFVFKVDVALSAGSSAQIALPVPSTFGRRDGFIAISSIAVSSIDHRKQEGPLGTPSKFSVTSPAPTGVPSKPYPCGMDLTAVAGYASPPNRAGRSTICLTWDTGTLTPSEGLRYEVVRALDNAILAAHRRDWQLGKIETSDESLVVVGSTLSGNLESIGPVDERGMIPAKFVPPSSAVDAALFRSGRLKATRPSRIQIGELEDVYYQVTLSGSSGNHFDLLLRGPSDPLPTPSSATLESAPDYANARQNDEALQHLALEAPNAFALATGVPISSNTFTDDVAGRGRNRFFYRVRAVDAAENRSEWSQISAPFYQVDTTPPETPSIEQVILGDRLVTLVLQRHNDSGISGYRFYRRENLSLGPLNVLNVVPYATVEADDMLRLPLTGRSGSILLPQPLEYDFAAGANSEISNFIAERVSVEEVAASLVTNIFDQAVSKIHFEKRIREDGTLVARVTALSEIPSLPDNSPLRVTAVDATISRSPLVKGIVTISEDSTRQIWNDADLIPDENYEYHLVAFKRVRAGPAAGSGHPSSELIVVSELSAPIPIVAVDRRIPPAPVIVQVEWLDLNNDPVADPALGKKLRLVIEATRTAAQLLVQRQKQGTDAWVSPLISGSRGWQSWPAGATQIVLIAEGIDSSESALYRALIRVSNGRTSEPSALVTF